MAALYHVIQGVIECPQPDKDIRRFDANLRLFPPFIDNDFCSLTINNTLLQSCYLRNTEWACGVAVYTGMMVVWKSTDLLFIFCMSSCCFCEVTSRIEFRSRLLILYCFFPSLVGRRKRNETGSKQGFARTEADSSGSHD